MLGPSDEMGGGISFRGGAGGPSGTEVYSWCLFSKKIFCVFSCLWSSFHIIGFQGRRGRVQTAKE